MANATIPSLPAAVALSGNEQLEIVQGGTSMRCTVAQIVYISLSSGNISVTVCSNRQFRSALSALGLEVTVDNAVPADINDAVTNQWQNGSVVVQNDALWTFTATTIGYNSTQMLALFASALTYPM